VGLTLTHAPHSVPHRSFDEIRNPARPEGSAFIVLMDSSR
jgi:hypothetical protein